MGAMKKTVRCVGNSAWQDQGPANGSRCQSADLDGLLLDMGLHEHLHARQVWPVTCNHERREAPKAGGGFMQADAQAQQLPIDAGHILQAGLGEATRPAHNLDTTVLQLHMVSRMHVLQHEQQRADRP